MVVVQPRSAVSGGNLSSHTLSELRLTRLDERSDSSGPFCLSARAVVCVLAQRGGCARVVLSGLDGRRDDCGMAFGELVAGLGERDDCAGARGGVVGPGLDGLRAVVLMRRDAGTPFTLRSGPAGAGCSSASVSAFCEACCSASASSCHLSRDLVLLAPPRTGTGMRLRGGRTSSDELPRCAADGPGSFDGVGSGASRPSAPNFVNTWSSFRSRVSLSLAGAGGERHA